MKLNPKERAVLAGVLADRERLAALDWNGIGLSYHELGIYRMQISDARAGCVHTNLAGWLGHAPSPSECVMFHRAYKRLETLGLLERVCLYGDGQRTTHLKLTDPGERIARQAVEVEA